MIRHTIIALGLLFIMTSPVSGQGVPCVIPPMDQVDARVRAKVSPSSAGFEYQYVVENGPRGPQFLIRFAVQAFSAEGTVLLQQSPSSWEARGRIADTAFYSWTTFTEPRGLRPGSSAAGFGFSNGDLPAIVTFLAWNDVEAPKLSEREAPASCQGDDLIENSFKGATVAPRPPARELVPIEFLNFLISLVHDSHQLGWIKVDGVRQSLLAKLTNAQRKLEAGDTKVPKNILNAFLNEVQATSCQDFTCPGNKPLTSEAYALLFFNGQFFLTASRSPTARRHLLTSR